MNAQQRAALLGLAVGLAHTVVRLFVVETGSTAINTPLADLLLGTLVSTLVLLAVVPGIPLYVAWRADSPQASSPLRLAAVVGLGTGVAVVLSYPILTATRVGAPFDVALQMRLVGPYAVNALSPAVYSGVAALAGFLLADRS
jgi:uncharacterized membrane protein YqjE